MSDGGGEASRGACEGRQWPREGRPERSEGELSRGPCSYFNLLLVYVILNAGLSIRDGYGPLILDFNAAFGLPL